jgi:hypothetical protein
VARAVIVDSGKCYASDNSIYAQHFHEGGIGELCEKQNTLLKVTEWSEFGCAESPTINPAYPNGYPFGDRQGLDRPDAS